MTTQIKSIKHRIQSISNIKKITHTMELVSVSKMRKAVRLALASREYAKYAIEILKTLIEERNISHPLFESQTGEKTLMVIFSSNKGLSGSYNSAIMKAVGAYINLFPTEHDVLVIGKYAERTAKKYKFNIVSRFHEFGDDISLSQIKVIRKFIITEYLESKKYKNVVVAYTEFESQMKYIPVVKEVLPISQNIMRNITNHMESEKDYFTPNKEGMAQYIFEPGEQRVMDKVLPNFISALLFQMALESNASEHSSRMFAMKNATENAEELVDHLTLEYNRARQSNITQEVAEIIAGAEALQTN
ncbi:MAG: ATP synthase F1 subunit gamma [Minisyncoccia bacterium]